MFTIGILEIIRLNYFLEQMRFCIERHFERLFADLFVICYPRCARHQERGDIRVLSRTLPGHHLCDQNQEENSLLLLQPDRALSPHSIHGCAGIHPPT